MVNTILAWSDEILAFHQPAVGRITNSHLEGTNNLLQVLRRVAYGFINRANYQTRHIRACGPTPSPQPRPPAPIPPTRAVSYSTNAIESLNSRLREAAVKRGHFPTDPAALKVLCLVSIKRWRNRSNTTGRINGWKAILNTLTIRYNDRITAVTDRT